MAKLSRNNPWVIDKFTGGLSEGSKRGIEGSFRAGQGLDYKSDPDSLTGLRKLTKDSGSTITDEIKWIITEGTNTWFYGDTGKVYKRDTAGTWTNPKTISSSSGNGMALFDDYIYFTSDSDLHRYGPLSGTPAWDDAFLTGTNPLVASAYTAGASYTIPTSISETSANKYSFTPTATNISGAILQVNTVGSDDITLTMHDSSDTHLGEVTKAIASISTNDFVLFQFDNPLPITSGNTYHFHLTSATADSTVRGATNLSDIRIGVETNVTSEDIDKSSTADRTFQTGATDYSLPSAVKEKNEDMLSFVPDKSNITAVTVYIKDASDAATYNWTVTLHDDENTSLGTGTLSTNSSSGYVRIDFSSVITNITPGATYHLHLSASASASDPTVFTTTSEDLETAYYKIHYQILDTDTEYHPLLFFPPAAALVIGNGNFLAVYDGVAYRSSGQGDGSEKLKLAREEKVRALDIVGDYLAIGVWRGDNIDDHGTSNLYFWDGASTAINAFKPITGEANAIKTGMDGLLHVIHGGFGYLSIYDGGLTLVHQVPSIGENKYVEVDPGAITNHDGVVKFGISDGDSTAVIRGVYSYGRKSKNYPRSLNLEAPISTGTTDNNVKVTAMLGIGPDKFFVAWKDSSSYGVDLISSTGDQTTVSYESLIFDAGIPYFEKKSKSIKLTFAALTSGQSIKIYTKEDRASSFTLLDTYNTVGQIVGSTSFDARWKELELKIELITTGNDSPTLISCTTFFDIVGDMQE